MYWKQRENNRKNCINIGLKCLIELASRMDFSKLLESLTQKKVNKEHLKLCSVRKFL